MDEIICPECGERIGNPEDYDDWEVISCECGERFAVTRKITVTYIRHRLVKIDT